MRNTHREVEYIFVHAVEVTDLVRSRQSARDDAQLVETLHRVAAVLAAELDLDRLVQTITDAATETTGPEFGAFFYNRVDDRGESYMLCTISGVPPERDSRLGLNPPYHCMPEGHLPVHSY